MIAKSLIEARVRLEPGRIGHYNWDDSYKSPDLLKCPEAIEDEISAKISEWAVEHGTCVEVWGALDLAYTILSLAESGQGVKVLSWEGEEDEKYRAKVNKMIEAGWVLLAYENNIDQFEAILSK